MLICEPQKKFTAVFILSPIVYLFIPYVNLYIVSKISFSPSGINKERKKERFGDLRAPT